MSSIINPDEMDALEWFDRTTQNFEDLFPAFVLERVEDWKDWAANSRRVQPQIPDPYQFADWREWAHRFNQTVNRST